MFIKIPLINSYGKCVRTITCPLNAIMLDWYIDSTDKTHFEVYLTKEFNGMRFDIGEKVFQEVQDAMKQANILEIEDLNLRANKTVISPKIINAVMGLEV